MRPIPTFVLLAALGACSSPRPSTPPPEPAITEAGAPVAWLDSGALEPFDLKTTRAVLPEVDRETGRGAYSMVFALAPAGDEIHAHKLGAPSGSGESAAPSIGLRTEFARRAKAGQLHAVFPHTEDRVLLAEWTLDGTGRVIEARIRTLPVLEFRTRGAAEGPPPLEWRLFGEKAWRR